ncbi:MAG: META domain-containing protein [Bacteroidales bacterium]|nr:META domain-containing protein [Bacteroidales bacterium]
MKKPIVQGSSLFLLLTLLVVTFMAAECKKPNKGDIKSEKNTQLYNTWILIQKDNDGVVTISPENDVYPITLTIDEDNQIKGRHDANVYKGIYQINQNSIFFTFNEITDVMDINWYLDYLSELENIDNILYISNDTLQLSGKNSSLKLLFLNKGKFEDEFFELEEWYNF